MTRLQRFRDEPKAPRYSLLSLNWTEVSKQSDYRKFSLCFMARNINLLHIECFPILAASHNKNTNSVMIVSVKLCTRMCCHQVFHISHMMMAKIYIFSFPCEMYQKLVGHTSGMTCISPFPVDASVSDHTLTIRIDFASVMDFLWLLIGSEV